jgi:hypothetical protein
MNYRRRERVPTQIVGNGSLLDSGQEFTFTGVDFTVMGMQLQMDGVTPVLGQQVALEFEVTDMGEGEATVAVQAEIMRVDAAEDGAMCGVKWTEGQDAKNIEALETYYMECFFDMID